MKKILFLTVIGVSLLYSNTINIDEDKCITKKELMIVLKKMFPGNKNINEKSLNLEKESAKEYFDKYSIEAIVKKMKYHNKRGNGDEVLKRCTYLIEHRDLQSADKMETLGVCADYKIKYYEYDGAIEYLEKQLDINDGTLDVREAIRKLIYLYEKKDNKEKVRYLKNIIND